MERLLRVVALLLMPLAVWAASFGGGWLGAVLAPNGAGESGIAWLGIGGALGGVVGLIVWLLLIRALRRWRRAEDQGPASTATS
jgi:hypothetical protein